MNRAKSDDSPATSGGLDSLSPRQIVEELDKYIIGQNKAKRALAVALRDRIRRQRLPEELLDEVQPRNIILIGPTGVGKTELARRLARLSNSPFIKVEASKFTEVGYVGRDVESIVRDLADGAVDIVRQEKVGQVEKLAEENAQNRLLDILNRPQKRRRKTKAGEATATKAKETRKTRARLLKELSEGKLDDQVVELEVQERFVASSDWSSDYLDEESDLPLRDILTALAGSRTTKKKMRVEEAFEYLIAEEENKLVDMEQVTREALDRLETSGIVFVDELDKIAGRESKFGPEVSREGVQRDILPIVEGTSVSTRLGMVRTDHILFIAAGAFHVSKPSDLIPELQGRFPIRVEMEPLREEDFRAILSRPKTALTRQYTALLATEGVQLEFEEEAIDEIAHLAWVVNETTENIGARRLHTMMETLLEDVSFEGPELKDQHVRVDRAYVRERLSSKVKDLDLSRYIL
jgi:ATP-dependent HslUV protease ATP-binding subunit HslU